MLIALLAAMTMAAIVLLPSSRARGWAKVKIAKHFFEHRYDYRTEWLRFTETIGATGPEGGAARPAGDQGLRRHPRRTRRAAAGRRREWRRSSRPRRGTGRAAPIPARPSPAPRRSAFWLSVGAEGRIIDFDALGGGWADARDRDLDIPAPLLGEEQAWTGVPLIHDDRLVGLVLLAAPDYRRPLDWEDFDLLRAAGRQAASSLAEAHGQQALMNAQRFEDFNRRFAFILHDVKNLVSQLSLLVPQRRAARRQCRIPRRHGGDAQGLGRQDERAARPARADARPAPGQARADAASARWSRRRSPPSGGDHEVMLLGDGNLWVMADPLLLEQAIGHLVQNAVDASTPHRAGHGAHGRRRQAGHRSPSPTAGTGMDAEFVRTRLFQPFASTKKGGFGVGAFEAKSLVSAMGGRLTVESKPGEGSSFTITLPAAEAAAEPKRKTRMSDETELPVLLIVEDDEGLQRQLKWAYEGYRVVSAGDRAQAIEMVRLHEPAVVTLDLGLPPDPDGTAEGFATLTEILALKPDTKIIVASGHGARESALKAIALGAYDFYRKPVDIDELGLIVSRAFHVHEIEEENRRLEAAGGGATALGALLTGSPEMVKVIRTIERVASADVSVMLLGASGTGKELLARAVHEKSARGQGRVRRHQLRRHPRKPARGRAVRL